MHAARIPPVDAAPATITTVLSMHAGHICPSSELLIGRNRCGRRHLPRMQRRSCPASRVYIWPHRIPSSLPPSESLATLKQLPQACQRLGEEVPFAPRDKPDGTRYSPKASAPFPSDRLSASAAPAHPAFLSPDRPALHPRAPTLCRRRPKVPARARPPLNP